MSAFISRMKRVALIFGILAVLLGGFWLLQGLGLVHLRPILCVANCAPVEGPSLTWAVVGFLVVVAGAGAIAHGRRRAGR